MKSTALQRLFANKWTLTILFFGTALTVAIAIALPLQNDGYIRAVFSGAVIGVMTAYFATKAVYTFRARLNGAPFHKGEQVQILAGKHKNQIVTVYEEWRERGQVRVDLGEDAKTNVKDVYANLELKRPQ